MERRHALKLIPLSLAGIAASGGRAQAHDKTPLALQFTARMREQLDRIKSTQSEVLLETSYRVAETIKNGHKCYISWDMGHRTTYDIWPDRPGDTDIFVKDFPEKAEKGDLIITNAAASEELIAKLRKFHEQGVFIIGGPRSWGGDCIGSELIVPEIRKLKVRPLADLWIELYETAYGAVVNVPGSPFPMGPSSGGSGVMTYWMITANAARLLARSGTSFTVSGDEPSSSAPANLADVNLPLGDLYYEKAVAQQRTIDSERDSIGRIATMAVHSVLRGGRLYIYSRYEPYACAECFARRGGLGLAFGVYGPPDKLVLMDDPVQLGKMDLRFKPTSKDTVIMGLARPDDPDDLASLDYFRKIGMRVASIGPATRDGVVPSGRTVPKETDVHMGGACDTYGLFALPGAKRKICPTSGFMVNQSLWAICLEIAEQIIDRTGTVPGIYLNGAMEGGMERSDEVKKLLRERGY